MMVKKWFEENMMANTKHTTPHQDLKYILLTAQFFGVLPVQGVTNSDVNQLKFKWITIRVFYSIFLTIPTFMLTALAFYRVSQEEADAVSKFCKFIYNTSTIGTQFTYIYILQLPLCFIPATE